MGWTSRRLIRSWYTTTNQKIWDHWITMAFWLNWWIQCSRGQTDWPIAQLDNDRQPKQHNDKRTNKEQETAYLNFLLSDLTGLRIYKSQQAQMKGRDSVFLLMALLGSKREGWRQWTDNQHEQPKRIHNHCRMHLCFGHFNVYHSPNG